MFLVLFRVNIPELAMHVVEEKITTSEVCMMAACHGFISAVSCCCRLPPLRKSLGLVAPAHPLPSQSTSPRHPPTPYLNALLLVHRDERNLFSPSSSCRVWLLVCPIASCSIHFFLSIPLTSHRLPSFLPLGCFACYLTPSQSERDRVLYDFKEGRSLILVATDVASRGLDVKDIRMVVNFDFPSEMEVK